MLFFAGYLILTEDDFPKHHPPPVEPRSAGKNDKSTKKPRRSKDRRATVSITPRRPCPPIPQDWIDSPPTPPRRQSNLDMCLPMSTKQSLYNTQSSNSIGSFLSSTPSRFQSNDSLESCKFLLFMVYNNHVLAVIGRGGVGKCLGGGVASK